MVKRKELLVWINKKCDSIVGHLHSYCITHEGEDLHKLRLEVKKIKALVYLMQKTTENGTLDFDIIGLRDLFKHSGRIRDAQQHLKLLARQKLNDPAIINQHLESKQKEEEELCRQINVYQLQVERARTLLRDCAAPIKNKEALEVIHKQYDKLANSLPGTIEINDLHEQRKKIKRLLYMLDILPETISQDLRFNKEYLEQVAQKIGDWHDSILAANFLNLPQIRVEADTLFNEINSMVIGFESKSIL